MSSSSLYIENFPLNTTEATLTKLFSHFGKVKRIELPHFEPEHPICRGLPKPKSKGYAFIEFMSKGDAEKAYIFFNDINHIVHVDDRSSIVKYQDHSELDTLRIKIMQNLEFKSLLLIRVMPRQKFQELTRHYHEHKFQSSVRAAKLLLVV